MTPKPQPTPLAQIDIAAGKLSDLRADLADCVGALNAEIEESKRHRLPQIKRFVARCAEVHAELTNLIDANRDLFVRPRTHIFHGIKLGLEKGKGKIIVKDPDRTVALIEKLFPEHAGALLHIKKSPNKEALGALAVEALKAIGCTIEDTGDQILIKFTDSAVDKAVKALLKDAIDDATNQQAA